MSIGRPRSFAIMLVCAGLAGGCAEPRPFLGRHTTIGTLKASVSQLEFEKHQLQRDVANLKVQNRRMEQQLSQEEAARDELVTRLDDARVLLKSRGYDIDAPSGTASSGAEPDPFEQPITKPAADAPRTRRRAPFARIPGHIEPAPSTNGQESEEDDALDPPPPSRSRDPYGPQSRLDRSGSRWQRVAERSSRHDATDTR